MPNWDQTEGFGSSVTHGWATEPRWERSAAMVARRTLGQNNYQSLSPTQLLHKTNITLSKIKCERHIFIKKCVRSFIEVRHYGWLCSTYICICMWLYKSSRIHLLHLCSEVGLLQSVSCNDTKLCDVEVPVMLVLWRMQFNPSLPSFSGPLLPGVVAADRVLSMGQIELNCVLMLKWYAWIITFLTFNSVLKNYTYTKLNCLN